MAAALLMAGCAALTGCNKEIAPDVQDMATKAGEIVLAVDDSQLDMAVSTKATEVTSLSTLNIVRTTGTWKSETNKDAKSSASVSAGKINTGWYQTATPTGYNYYLSNSAMTFAAGGSTIAATNTTDIIAGCTNAANSTLTPSVTLEHIFARTAGLTANAPAGYSISGVTWKIQSKAGGTGGTAGTYNIATKAWSGVTALANTTFTASSDLYLTPGVYTVSITYTLTKGDYSKTSTKSGDVTLVAGKKNSISVKSANGDGVVPFDDGVGAQEIVLSVTLTPWGTNSVDLNI